MIWVAPMLVLTGGLVALSLIARAVAAETRRLRRDLAPLPEVAGDLRAAAADVTAVGEDVARLRERARLRPTRH